MQDVDNNKVMYQFRKKSTGEIVKILSGSNGGSEVDQKIESEKKELEAVHGELSVIKAEKLF